MGDLIIFVFTFGSVCGYFVFIEQFAPDLFASLGFPDGFEVKEMEECISL